MVSILSNTRCRFHTLIAAVVAHVFALTTLTVQAQSERIDTQWQVYDVGFGTKPSFDFDSAGRLHVMGMTEDLEGVIWYASADRVEGPWDPEVIDTGYFYGPGDLRVGPDGTAHIAWHDHDVEDPSHMAISPQGEKRLFQISSPGHNGWDNSLAFDSSGTLYQSSVNPSGFGALASLEYGVFDGNGWEHHTVANSDPFMYGLNSSVALDSADKPHFVYCACDDWATPGDLRYASPAGNGFDIQSIATGGIRGRFADLAIDSQDRPHVAWLDIDPNDLSRGLVQYAILENGNWNTNTIDTLENVRLGFRFARKLVSLELDSQDVPHVAYGDQSTVQYAVRGETAADWSNTSVLLSDDQPYNGLVVLRLDGNDNPAIAFWQPDFDQFGVVRIASRVGGPALQAGDANQDLEFNQLDLFQILRAEKFLTGQPATWGEGDWNGAPGGRPGNPPRGDGLFNAVDLIAALRAGTWLTGPYAAVTSGGETADGQTSVGYDSATGQVWVDPPRGTELTSINIDSTAGVFTADAAQNLGGSFDNDSDDNIFKATFGGSFGSLSFGHVAQRGLSEEFVLSDLTIVGSVAGGGALGAVDLIYVPEPSGLLLLLLGVLAGQTAIRAYLPLK